MPILVVRKSAISGGGIARVHISVLEDMGIEPGENIVVRSGNRAIIVKVFGDNLVEKGDIRLRAKDMKRLGVKKGDRVEIEPLIPLIPRVKKVSKSYRKRMSSFMHDIRRHMIRS